MLFGLKKNKPSLCKNGKSKKNNDIMAYIGLKLIAYISVFKKFYQEILF